MIYKMKRELYLNLKYTDKGMMSDNDIIIYIQTNFNLLHKIDKIITY